MKNKNCDIFEETGKTFTLLMLGLAFAGAIGFSIGIMNDAMEKYFSTTSFKYMGVCFFIGISLQGFFNIKIAKEFVFGIAFFFFGSLLQIGVADGLMEMAKSNNPVDPVREALTEGFIGLASSIPYMVSTFYLVIVIATLYFDYLVKHKKENYKK